MCDKGFLSKEDLSLYSSKLSFKDFDYKNVYGTKEYTEWNDKYIYVFDEQYLDDEDITELPDGYCLYQRSYLHETDNVVHASGLMCELRKDGECIYKFVATDDHHNPYTFFINHSNGHRYYPFNVDLYGISYIDVDTLEVFNYVPAGLPNSYGIPCGESFIVTNIFYDPKSDLVAYEGCYWADMSDVMIGRLDDPLNFDPHLISISRVIDHEDLGCCDIDFVSWEEDGITVKADGDNGVKDVKITKAVLDKAAGIKN